MDDAKDRAIAAQREEDILRLRFVFLPQSGFSLGEKLPECCSVAYPICISALSLSAFIVCIPAKWFFGLDFMACGTFR